MNTATPRSVSTAFDHLVDTSRFQQYANDIAASSLAFDVALREWRDTALALADPDRREVLLGAVATEDFELAARPQ